MSSRESSRLFEDLMVNYNNLIRPAKIPSEAIEIQFKFKLLQILDVVFFVKLLNFKHSLAKGRGGGNKFSKCKIEFFFTKKKFFLKMSFIFVNRK